MDPTSREARLVLEARAQSLISQDLKLKGTMTLRLDALVAANKAVKLEVPALSLVFPQPHTHPHPHSFESCMTVSRLREQHSKSLFGGVESLFGGVESLFGGVEGHLEAPTAKPLALGRLRHSLTFALTRMV